MDVDEAIINKGLLGETNENSPPIQIKRNIDIDIEKLMQVQQQTEEDSGLSFSFNLDLSKLKIKKISRNIRFLEIELFLDYNGKEFIAKIKKCRHENDNPYISISKDLGKSCGTTVKTLKVFRASRDIPIDFSTTQEEYDHIMKNEFLMQKNMHYVA